MLTRRSLLVSAGAAALASIAPGCRYSQAGSLPAEGEAAPRRWRPGLARIPEWMDQYRVPGLSIATLHGGQVNWAATYGIRRVGEPGAVDDRTVFEAASMSKPLFACAVLRLVEKGTLSLDTPLDEYLGEPYAPEEPATSKITARMVLTHTSGLPNWRQGGDSAPLYLLNPPGREFGYSGEGFVYLQTAIEELVGSAAGPYLEAQLLDPLGMSRSSYTWLETYADNYGHGHDEEGEPRDYAFSRRANTAASLYTTPLEYAQYLVALMRADARLLEPETVEQMLTPASERAKDLYVGLGWGLCRTLPGRQIVYHSGSNSSGHRCLCAFEREEGTGFVVMSNGMGGATLRRHVADTIYPGAGIP
jgi:CubicO group peptidase (beta-lactamase class C family)